MKTVVITHVYELALPYLREMFESIDKQTDKEFDLVVFNYGVSKPLIEFGFSGIEIKNKWGLGIPDARDWAMKYALDNEYDLAVFIDADDVMADDRVEKTKECFDQSNKRYGLFYADLHLLHEPDHDFFEGNLPAFIDNYSIIENTNCVGLSNLAIDVNVCRKVIEKLNVPDYVIAYDWYFSSLLLLHGISGCLVPTKTYYRIHGENLAGNTNTLNAVHRTVAVKKAHYNALVEFNSLWSLGDVGKKVVDNAHKYEELSILLEKSKDLSDPRLKDFIKTESNSHWWGIV